MSIAVSVSADGVRVPLSRERVESIARGVLRAEGVLDALLSVAFVSRAVITSLNARYLGRRRPTDVIVFGFDSAGKTPPVVGDIYIAPEVARANAADFGTGVRDEVARLVIHGVLHVLGYDHGDRRREESSMWRRQEQLLRRLAEPGRRRAGAGP